MINLDSDLMRGYADAKDDYFIALAQQQEAEMNRLIPILEEYEANMFKDEVYL